MLNKITKSDAKFLVTQFKAEISNFGIEMRQNTDRTGPLWSLFYLVPHALGKIAESDEYKDKRVDAKKDDYLFDSHMIHQINDYPDYDEYYSKDPQEFLEIIFKSSTLEQFKAALNLTFHPSTETHKIIFGISDFYAHLLLCAGQELPILLYKSADNECAVKFPSTKCRDVFFQRLPEIKAHVKIYADKPDVIFIPAKTAREENLMEAQFP